MNAWVSVVVNLTLILWPGRIFLLTASELPAGWVCWGHRATPQGEEVQLSHVDQDKNLHPKTGILAGTWSNKFASGPLG